MKQLIVMISAVMLGVYLFNMVIGPQDGSVLSVVRKVWIHEIEIRNMEEFQEDVQ